MLLLAQGKTILNFINSLRNLYGHFWPIKNGCYEYYLKLDGYYYCNRQKCTLVVIRVRNKRTTEIIPLTDIINDKDYLQALHPNDACALGILANNERNGVIDNNNIGWKQMNRSKEYSCFVKAKPLLEITCKYTNNTGIEMIVLRSTLIKKEIEIPMIDLFKNQALLYSLDSLQAISIGYDISELYVKNKHSWPLI